MAKPGHRDKACWRAKNAIGVGNVLKMNWRKISRERTTARPAPCRYCPIHLTPPALPPLVLPAEVPTRQKPTLDFLIPQTKRGTKKSNGTRRVAPRTPDEHQPDTGTIVILVANGRTEVAKLMPQLREAFEGNLPTSTLKGFFDIVHVILNWMSKRWR